MGMGGLPDMYTQSPRAEGCTYAALRLQVYISGKP